MACPPSPPSKNMWALYLQECRSRQSSASGEPVWACSRLRKALYSLVSAPVGGGANLTTMSNVGWLCQQNCKRPGFEVLGSRPGFRDPGDIRGRCATQAHRHYNFAVLRHHRGENQQLPWPSCNPIAPVKGVTGPLEMGRQAVVALSVVAFPSPPMMPWVVPM
jgi:hypothetical protein